MIVGIDFGTTLTKIILMDEMEVVAFDTINRDEDYLAILKKYDLLKVSKIMITGTGASYINTDILDIPTEKVDEFKAIAVGGYYFSGIDECIVVSLGTGTSFTYMTKERIEHVGGSGIGGGLLHSLGKIGIGVNSNRDLISLAEKGSLNNADLLVKDISKVPIDNMTGNITVANMAKLDASSDKHDFAYGACNLVFQNIGVMAVMTARAYNTKTILVMGTVVQNRVAKEMFDVVAKLFGYNFIIPENVSHGVALGAALYGYNKFMNANSVYEKDLDDLSYHFE